MRKTCTTYHHHPSRAGQKFDISNFLNDSSPAFGTEKSGLKNKLEAFLNAAPEVWQQIVAAKYPYKLARLVHHRYNMNKRWYIILYAWDVSTDKLTRYRLFEPLNRIKDKQQRITQANVMVNNINAQLKAGKVLGKNKPVENVVTSRPGKLSLLQAIEFVETQKKKNGHRENYYRSFKTLQNNLAEWLAFKIEPDFALKEFNEQDARDFFTYLRDEKKLSNKSINNIHTNLGIAFKFLEKETDGRIWRKDPLRHFSKLPVLVRKHAAYTDEQISVIKEKINEQASSAAKHRAPGYVQLELFISFIYYLLARPNEIMQLMVRDIDLKKNRVRIAAHISKNKIEEYVEIAPRLAKSIKASGILTYQGDWYVFSKNGIPGITRLHENFFWDKHHRVLKKAGMLNQNYSLYSYKHSGVIALYKATKDIKLVQRQCRHQSLEQTNIYLRDLGTMSDYNQLKKYSGAM